MGKVYFPGWASILKYSIAITGILLAARIQAQQLSSDTLKLSLPAAEKMFIEKNLTLLASKYNIDANKALIEQAGLWDNPVLVTDQNIYAGNKFFAHGKDAAGQPTGQYFIQVQQLIKTAGKRSKLVDLATTNAQISQLQFNEVMRTLKYQLRTDFFTITQLWGNHIVFTKELTEMNRLLGGMEAQLQAGNIAQKDYLRIQALILSMQQDITDNDKQLADTEAELKTLLQVTGNSFILPQTETPVTPNLAALKVADLIDSAKLHNSAYAIEQTQLKYQNQNLVYQKALKVPDVTVGPEYDHNSNYTPHYFGLSVSLPLPLLNKNQGNIKSAQIAIKQQETTLAQVEQQLNITVQNAINKLYLTTQLSSGKQQDFYSKYDQLFLNVTDSYQKRQIGLLEFIDFFDAYKDIQLKKLQQQLNLQLAKQELNYQVGTDVIN